MHRLSARSQLELESVVHNSDFSEIVGPIGPDGKFCEGPAQNLDCQSSVRLHIMVYC